MNSETLIEDFNNTIDFWIEALAGYNFPQLCVKPSPERWSLGQMYVHMIDDTRFYIEQIKICLTTNDHATDEALPFAKRMLLNNAFPDEALKGAPDHSGMPQPANKEQLINDLANIKAEMNLLAVMISESPFKGKSKHPGFNYFSALEWLQFTDMHFRHHLRQKKRIDDFLRTA